MSARRAPSEPGDLSVHRLCSTSTVAAAAMTALATCPTAPTAAAPMGVVVNETRTGTFTTFSDDYNPEWLGDVARIKEKRSGFKLKSTRNGVSRGGRPLTPGTIIGGGFGGSSSSGDGVSSGSILDFSVVRPGWTQVDTSKLLNPFQAAVDPDAKILDGADTGPSFDFVDYDNRLVTSTKATAALDGAKAKAKANDATSSLEEGLYRFSEVLLEQRNGKDKVLANSSAVAEAGGYGGRVSAQVIGQPNAKGRGTANAVAQEAQTYDIVRTQIVDVNILANVRGGGRLNLELVDLNTGESVLSWTSEELTRDGKYEIDLVTAVDPGNGRDGVADLEMRVSADASATGKAKSSKVRVLSAVEYTWYDRYSMPSDYVAPQWTYTPTAWQADAGPISAATFLSADDEAAAEIPIVRTGGAEGDLPTTVWDRLPFNPATLGTDAYQGAYVLADAIRAELSGPLADAVLTPRNDGKYFLSFGEDVVVDDNIYAFDGRAYEDVRGHSLGLFDALIALGFSEDDVATALLVDSDTDGLSYLSGQAMALDGHLKGELVNVQLVEALGPIDWLWQPLEVTDYRPGYWELTREEYMPTAEEALATYAAENGLDLGGPAEAGAVAAAIALTDAMLDDPFAMSAPAPEMLSIGAGLPEDLSIYGTASMLASAAPVSNPTPTAAAGGLAGMTLLLRRRGRA